MKINEIIKEHRLKMGLTQEQIANRLGVTTPAVNKWERGVSFPDITVLPPLARLLGIDLNTLLSFKEDLSDKEVGELLNQISELSVNGGFKEAYDFAMDKLAEYPTCYKLILQTALVLEGTIIMDKELRDSDYSSKIEGLYVRALASTDEGVRNQAQSMLFSKYLVREEFDKAQDILDNMADKNPVGKKQLQANLHTALGEWDQAAKMYEELLLASLNDVQGALIQVMEAAIKQERLEDAKHIAQVSKQAAELFDQWEYQSYAASLMLYFNTKDTEGVISILEPMLKSMTKKWDIASSPLYRHVDTKAIEPNFGERIQKMAIESIYKDDQTEFLRDNPQVKQIVDSFHLE